MLSELAAVTLFQLFLLGANDGCRLWIQVLEREEVDEEERYFFGRQALLSHQPWEHALGSRRG